MNLTLSDSELNKLIKSLLEKINNLDFVIIPTEKNQKMMTLYKLNKSKSRDLVLSKISKDNFVSYEFDRDTSKYGVGYVLIFIFDCKLINLFGENVNVKVYVKIKENKDMLPVLSMHESIGGK